MKQEWFPRPHDGGNKFAFGLETGVANQSTIYPIAFHDEGLGAPSSYKANPENSGFAETSSPNCYPDSRINSMAINFDLAMTKSALETDKIHAIRYCWSVIKMSFKENYIAIDELSQDEVQDITEMQYETTDRQGYPLWNGVKMPSPTGGGNALDANVPGLTTNQNIEGVAFSANDYYDAIQYETISGKLKNSMTGLAWRTIYRQKPFHRIKLRIDPKVKRMNPYTFFGLLIYVPESGNYYQIPQTGDTTNVNHLECTITTRFNEWHQNFDMAKA